MGEWSTTTISIQFVKRLNDECREKKFAFTKQNGPKHNFFHSHRFSYRAKLIISHWIIHQTRSLTTCHPTDRSPTTSLTTFKKKPAFTNDSERIFDHYFNLRSTEILALGRLQKTLNFISISGKKQLFTFAKKMLSSKGKNSGAMSWLSAA